MKETSFQYLLRSRVWESLIWLPSDVCIARVSPELSLSQLFTLQLQT